MFETIKGARVFVPTLHAAFRDLGTPRVVEAEVIKWWAQTTAVKQRNNAAKQQESRGLFAHGFKFPALRAQDPPENDYAVLGGAAGVINLTGISRMRPLVFQLPDGTSHHYSYTDGKLRFDGVRP